MPLAAAPTSGPAGNFITNISTNVSVQVFNVSSGTISTQLSLPYATAGQALTVNSAKQIISTPFGGGGSSTLAVGTGTVSAFTNNVSTPTAAISFNGAQFTSQLVGSATNFVSVNLSSITALGNNLAATFLTNSSATATYLQISSAAPTYLQASSATATYFNKSGILPVANGGTGVSSPGLIAGTNITSITGTWPNQTINASSGGGGVGGAFANWYLTDANGVHWSITDSTTGHLTTATVSSIPSGSLAPHQLVTQDASFNLWTITIDTGGHLVTTSSGTTAKSITDLLMNDSTNITWVNTVDTGGHLVTQ